MSKWFLLLIITAIALIIQFYKPHQKNGVQSYSIETHSHNQEDINKKSLASGSPSTSGILAHSSRPDESLNQAEELKKLVLTPPPANTWDSQRQKRELFEAIIKNRKQTLQLLQWFGDLDQMKSLFGNEQAKARVRLLEFFKHVKKDYSAEIVHSLIAIQRDPAFTNKVQGRDFDYRDLAKIYFSTLSEEYLKTNLAYELKKLQYNPKDNWLIAYAIAHAHPNLVKNSVFAEAARNLLAEEII